MHIRRMPKTIAEIILLTLTIATVALLAQAQSADGAATFKLADSSGDEGVIVEVRKGAPLKVLTRNPSNDKLEDIAGKIAH